MSTFPEGFLWEASTSPHQTEGNNPNSDWWARETLMPGMQPSSDACDSYHRYGEDMRLLADSGLNAYRFGSEWARIEPRPGQIAHAELARPLPRHDRDRVLARARPGGDVAPLQQPALVPRGGRLDRHVGPGPFRLLRDHHDHHPG